MSTSTYVHIGAFIKFSGPYKALKANTVSKCPKCRTTQTSKFCPECGSPITTSATTTNTSFKYFNEVLGYITELEGTTVYDVLDDIFAFHEFSDNTLIPCYQSSLYQHIDTDGEVASVDIGGIVGLRESAIDELETFGSNLIKLLDKYQVSYEIMYGVTVYGS